MMVTSILHLMKQARYVKSVMKKCGHLLSPGKYHIFDNFRSVCLEKTEIRNQAKRYFGFPSRTRLRVYIARILNGLHYFSVSEGRSCGTYEAIYLANNHDKDREAKLFSFTDRKILTLCTSRDEMCRQLGEYEMLHGAYKMPRVEKSDEFENALVVAMIQRLKFPGNAQALTAIAQAEMENFRSTADLPRRPVEELIRFSYSDETMTTCLSALAQQISRDLLSCSFPLCMQHGDLSKDNLIFGESEGETAFWWIDWEHIGDRVFFYDYFFYVINSAVYNDTGAFACYISGQNDEVLNQYFAHFGIDFDPGKKWDYFMIFAIVFLKERVCDLGHVSALVRYCRMLENLRGNMDKGVTT